MELREILKDHLQQSFELLKEFSLNDQYLQMVEEAALTIISSLRSGKKIISAGNGGSMCDAMHFTEELMGKWRKERDPIAAICINDPGYLTCVSNDFSFEFVFSRAVDALGQKGDIFFGITTSGNSKNIIKACEAAFRKGMPTIIMTSDTDGEIQTRHSHIVDNFILVPAFPHADRIQELHIKIIHSLIDMIERNLEK
jgi:D-sedoheptulose 7-phosphate isomerase